MDNLKYSEILQQNRALSLVIKGHPYKVSVLANVTINSLKDIFEYSLRLNQINPIIEIGNFDNIVQDSSKCNDSDLIVIFYDMLPVVDGLSSFFEDLSPEMYNDLKNKIFSEIDIIIENLKNCSSVVFNTFSGGSFVTNFTLRTKLDIFISELNEHLTKRKTINVSFIDIDKIFLQLGTKKAIDYRLFNSSKAPYSLSFFKKYVSAIEPIILRNTGKLKKAIIFDCDGTLWKGIIGEDGIDKIDMSKSSSVGRAYNRVQQIAAFLSKKGIIIGICSKNNEQDVTEVFNNHPDMVLKDEHIVIKKVNWLDKTTNLRAIASELNIGLDSMIFVDDSSFEINLIREQIPEIVSLLVPASVFEYPALLLENVYKYFNITANKEDTKKTELYRQQFQRENYKAEHKSIESYLSSLDLSISVYKDELLLVPRIAQLTQKTNQFNLTTKRYTENQILNFINNNDNHVFAAEVKDKFGESGLTAVCIIVQDSQNSKNVIIDTFLMSCRIIGRNIEHAFMNYIFQWLVNNHYISIYAEFIPTKKNTQVKCLYEDFGFILKNEKDNSKQYALFLKDNKIKNVEYIKIESPENTPVSEK